MTRAVFQAGLSWKAIDARWESFVRLFESFDLARVAAFNEADIERLLADGGIVRSRKKIVATIANARALLEIERTATLADDLRSFARYDDLAADRRKRFVYLGELSAYDLVFRVGEAVQRFETWETTIAGDHPRIREMITRAYMGMTKPSHWARRTQRCAPEVRAKRSSVANKRSQSE